MVAENFPISKLEQGEDDRNNKLSRIQKMLARILRIERNQDSNKTEITEDEISAKSAIQFTAASAIFSLQTDDDE
jgi:hypothetical protein